MDETVQTLSALRPRFEGQMCLVFGTGPSLSGLWQERASSLPKIAVNDAIYIVPDADVHYACDQSWWEHHLPKLSEAGPVRVGYEVRGLPGVVSLKGSGDKGFDPRLGYVRHGSNSGAQAVHLAAQLGASSIVLVGFDLQAGANGRHFFGEHPPEIRRNSPYDLFIDRFGVLGRQLAGRGVEVVNATPGSALPWFRGVELDQVVAS